MRRVDISLHLLIINFTPCGERRKSFRTKIDCRNRRIPHTVSGSIKIHIPGRYHVFYEREKEIAMTAMKDRKRRGEYRGI